MVDEALGSDGRCGEPKDCPFVEVMFAKSSDEAAGCRDLLTKQSIPARLEGDISSRLRNGFAVLVPPHCLIEASELLVTRIQDEEDDDILLPDGEDDCERDEDDGDEDADEDENDDVVVDDFDEDDHDF